MKLTNTLLLVAVTASMAACEKQSTDTATPADATAPMTEDMSAEPPMDDAMGEAPTAEDMSDMASEPMDEEGDMTAEEAAPES